MPLGMEVRSYIRPRHIALDGDPALSTKRGRAASAFRPMFEQTDSPILATAELL